MAKRGGMAEAVPLLDGPYQSRALISGAQRCVNLYVEANSPNSQAPVPFTHFLTPGLVIAKAPGYADIWRRLGLYIATNGEVFGVVGGDVYYIDANLNFTLVGSIANSVTPVSMQDNGLVLIIVDGTATGYALDLATHAFGVIGAGYQTASRVDYCDTYFVFNVFGTNQFYISLSNVTYAMLIAGTAFDSLDVAAKTGQPDPIASIIVLNGEIWLLGTLTSEVWANSGNQEFPFERIPGALIEHGMAAPYSVAKSDRSIYFLSKDREGRAQAVKSAGYALEAISPYAMAQDIQDYDSVNDAFGYTRQADGHAFYVMTFPTADKTWEIELSGIQAHEWSSMDGNGVQHRHRANCYVSAYGLNLVGDYQNSNLYNLDRTTYTDNGMPIVRLRSFPHMVGTSNRHKYFYFTADIGCGRITDGAADPLISMRYSDTRGASWGNAITRSMGKTGQYGKWPRWSRLGMARDRVFELSWSVDAETWLNGAFVAARPLTS